jgi:GalNAc-alpha-(1->4)-GalNAc-alpha-(1->3)-diNAcBac-PP-undecaprenol alpha-1,4-N-acetyl-D-galactosaminyltransferase
VPIAGGRVLFVAKSDGIGGVERKIAALVESFSGCGLCCHVVTLAEHAGPPGLLADVPKTVLEVRGCPGPLRRLLQLLRLRAIVAANHYDAVIGFGPSSNALVALSNRRGGPLAVIAEVGNPFIPRRRRWNQWWMWTYRRADVLVVQTERLADELRAFRRRPRRIVVIANMLSPSIPLVEPAQARPPVVAGVGRLVASKRYVDLVEAIARLGDQARDWRVVIVGDGDDRDRIEQRARELGVADRVEMTGWTDAPWTHLSDAAIFVLCSQNEGFANVLVEAAASGCAVISSDCRFGPREFLGDDEFGLLYPVGDVDALSARIGQLIADPARRLALAQAAHGRCRHFDRTSVTDEWLRLIGAGSSA